VSDVIEPSPHSRPSARREATTRREKVARVLFAIGGAAGAILVGIVVNVASEQINKSFDSTIPSSKSATCLTDASSTFAKSGHEVIEVFVAEQSQTNQHCWRRTLDDVLPGDVFQVEIHTANFKGKVVEDVVVEAWLPEAFELVPHTTHLRNFSNPDEKQVTDDIVGRGINIGNYHDGSHAYLIFDVRMKTSAPRPCSFTASTIAARLSYASQPDNAWASAAIVDVGQC
jgi:hypothetical protein